MTKATENIMVQREDGSYGVVLKGEDLPEPAQPARAQSAQPLKGEDLPEPAQPARAQSAQPLKQSK